jgi:ribosome biogenesis protein ERB1
MAISKKAKPVEDIVDTPTKLDHSENPDAEQQISDESDLSTDNFSSSDDSDDEVILNRSGDVPSQWYEDEEHRGYDIHGRKVIKTLMSSKIDELLKNADDPNRWRTIQDLQNEREVYLTDADIEIIRRLRSGQYPDGRIAEEDYFVEYDDEPHKLHPVRNKDLPKSRFLPSKDESKEIRRLVKLIRAGKLKPRSTRRSMQPSLFDIWAQSEEEEGRLRGPASLPAPKLPLPGHAESYRPPSEYLFTEEEKNEWLAGDESTRKSSFIPQSFGCLRRVPWYGAFITERFSRCLDLYTVPRMLKKKMNISADSLIPKLPQISDLRPFPSSLSVEYVGHDSAVTGVSVSQSWLASASADSVRVWDVKTSKAIQVHSTAGDWSATSIAWHPSLPVLAVGDDDGNVRFFVFKKLIVSDEVSEAVATLLEVPSEESANWKKSTQGKDTDILTFSYGTTTSISSISWHHRGNFLAVVSPQSPSKEKSCCVISLGNKKHVTPLKGKGQVVGAARHVIFHPTKPYLVVAGSSNVGVFDLKSQSRLHILNSNSDSLSSVAVHPAGDGVHVVATSLDSKVIWFDSEIRSKPWKTFRHHSSAVRKVAFHPAAGSTLPLMASVGDDNSAHVVYSKVFPEDANKNPMVVPVKKLTHPSSVKDCQWHPRLPWLFTACDDGVVRLWA